MTTWVLLAPGPSASADQAFAVHGSLIPLGAISNAYQLAPFARFVAASDGSWWRRHAEVKSFPLTYCMTEVAEVERLAVPGVGAICNSGVLGLEAAKRNGATRILLLGFDMHGTHFFGPYTNGLRNTTPNQRKQHLRQYADWQRANRNIEVYNCTPGSALMCFPVARLGKFIETSIPEPAAHEAGQGGDVCAGLAA